MPIYGAIPRGAYRQQPKTLPRSLGFERYALDFDGIEDYVDCGNALSLQFSCGLMTIEFWVKFVGNRWEEYLLGKYDGAGVGWYSSIRPIANTISWRPDNGGTYSDLGVDINDGNFHQIAISQEGSVAKLYTDGVYRNSWAGCYQNISVVNSLLVGAVDIQRAWAIFALVRLYKDYVLSPAEVEWNRLNYHNPVRPDKLALWLPMEEGAGLVAADYSGLGNDGALLPALTPPTWEQVKQWELRAETER